MSDDELDRLPPAHPRFAAHFTNIIYDPDNAENGDLPPFGSDEGWDEINNWAERLDDLQAHPTLRHMLGDGADEQIEELRRDEQLDVDDILIGQGFTLLRFTGQIDSEGRGWLIEALLRQDARTPGGEYATLLEDLTGYVPDPARPTKADVAGAAMQAVRAKPWVSITGIEDDQLTAWFKQIARAVAHDSHWCDWWARSDVEYLVIYLSPMGPPKRERTVFRSHQNRLEVVGNSARLTKMARSSMKSRTADRGALDVFRTPKALELWQSLILRLFHETGERLRIGPPPEQLPN